MDDTTVHDELAALRRIVRELDRLDLATRKRAMLWLADRYLDQVDDEPDTPR